MTADSVSEASQVFAAGPVGRKRCISGARPDEKPKKALMVDEPAPKKTAIQNNGWGPIFKNRETFVEMHLC